MQQTFDTTASTFELIALNICTQIIAFQNSISGRESGLRFPTLQETGMLCKLINCLDKLRKLAAPARAKQAMNGFITFLANDDAELGKIVAEKFKAFSGDLAEIKQLKNEPIQQPLTAQKPEIKHQTPQPQEKRTKTFHTPFSNGEITVDLIQQDFDQVTESDFKEYRSRLFEVESGCLTYDTTLYKSGTCNKRWLEYNLFQYLLPPDQRAFIREQEFIGRFNPVQIARMIKTHLFANNINK